MFSQNDEEAKIGEYFKDFKGRFLDVGAHDGVQLSNTWKLVLNGWSGVDVEACPMLIESLLANMKGRDVKVVNAAIGLTRSLVSFKTSGKSFGATMVDANVEKWKKELNFTEIFVAPVTWEVLFQSHPPPYHFISIDCEGMSESLVASLASAFTADFIGVKAICVEKDPGDHKNMDHLMTTWWKMRKYHETSENVIYVL